MGSFEEEFPSLVAEEYVGDSSTQWIPDYLISQGCLDKSELSKIIFKGDVSGFEKEIVEEIIDRFNLRKGD